MTSSDPLTKAALVLAQLPADQIVTVLRWLTPNQRQAVRRRLESFTQQEFRSSGPVLREFVATVRRFDAATSGSPQAPHHRLRDPSSRIDSSSLSFLECYSSTTMLSVLRDELPSTMAAVLGAVSPAYRGELLSAMPEEVRREVVPKIHASQLSSVAAEALARVLRKRLAAFIPNRTMRPELPDPDGGPPAERPREQESAAVPPERPEVGGTTLVRHDPPSCEFDALRHLPPQQVRAFLDQVELGDLAIAFIDADPRVKERILEQMRPRERANLLENIRLLGRLRRERTDRQRSRLGRSLKHLRGNPRFG